jgi:hypothetical protein
MYSRATNVTGDIEEALRLGAELTQIINDASSLRTTMWQQVLGQTPNVLAWTAMAESKEQLVGEVMKFSAIAEFTKTRNALVEHTHGPTDGMRYILNADALDGDATPPAVATVLISQSIGRYDDCFAFAIDMAAFSGELTGLPCIVAINTVGPMGQFSWHVGAASIGEMEAAEQKLWASEEYMSRMSEARDKRLFAPGVGGQSLFANVA